MSVIIASCGNKSSQTEEKENVTETKSDVTENTTQYSGNMALLQGQWQSVDDESNFIIFENNHRKEIATGTNGYDDNEFILSDKCTNDSDKNSENPKEKDKYISCQKDDMCWYIVKLDDKVLELSYVGRGNTLVYNKVFNCGE